MVDDGAKSALSVILLYHSHGYMQLKNHLTEP